MSPTMFEKAGGLSPTQLVRMFRGADDEVSAAPRLRLRTKVAYAIPGPAIAITDRPGDIVHLGKEVVASVGLCLEVWKMF